MKRQLDSLEEHIIDLVTKSIVDNYYETSYAKWTKIINDIFIDVGMDNGFSIYCSSQRKEVKSEWLWDISWSKESASDFDGWKDFFGLEMIVEVEWGNKDEILSDFMKLCVGLANYRVMVFEYFNESEGQGFDEVCNLLINTSSKVAAKGSKFLIIGLPYYFEHKELVKKYAWVIK